MLGIMHLASCLDCVLLFINNDTAVEYGMLKGNKLLIICCLQSMSGARRASTAKIKK